VALLPALTAEQRTAITAAGGVLASGLQWRPLGLGGNPLTGEGKEDSRLFEGLRVSAALDGELAGLGWNFALTYSQNERDADTADILVTQLDRALRRDPPLARLELSYDPFITNPLGRVVKIALGKRST
jgi:hypothetical protein